MKKCNNHPSVRRWVRVFLRQNSTERRFPISGIPLKSSLPVGVQPHAGMEAFYGCAALQERQPVAAAAAARRGTASARFKYY